MTVKVLLVWLLAWSAAAFAVCGWDKRRARRGGRRVSERTLWLLSLAGGAAGMLAGMQIFRHKTKHRSFVWGVPVVLLVQIAALIGLAL